MNQVLFYSPFVHRNAIKTFLPIWFFFRFWWPLTYIHCFGATLVLKLRVLHSWYLPILPLLLITFPSLKVWIQKHHCWVWKALGTTNQCRMPSGTSTLRRHTRTETNRWECLVWFVFFFRIVHQLNISERNGLWAQSTRVGVTHNSVPTFEPYVCATGFFARWHLTAFAWRRKLLSALHRYNSKISPSLYPQQGIPAFDLSA